MYPESGRGHYRCLDTRQHLQTHPYLRAFLGIHRPRPKVRRRHDP